ncbi:PAS domain-containing protein [Aspergillus pseudonomiae]|uniref:PAS domain-containing protein n=1 Tax=Aspergillus pseudonomiae TaxID=1506151 RepID=A0A5N7CYR2_9EURO|nr:PAS domain-containing protein [Aspergillus pseudonomiae]KAE8399291.1 PAS domain-containing protein [Aspergillus pseudonomiae]
MEGFSDGYYDAQYTVPASDHRVDYPPSSSDHYAQAMMPFTAPDQMHAASFAYQPQIPDLVADSASFVFPSHTAGLSLNLPEHPMPTENIGHRTSNAMFLYDPLSALGGSAATAINTGDPFAYNAFQAPFPTMPLENFQGQQSLTFHNTCLPSQPMNLNPSVAYSTMQTHGPVLNTYQAPPSHAELTTPAQPTGTLKEQPSTNFPQPAGQTSQRRRNRGFQSSGPASSHRFIQPKRPPPAKVPLPPHPKSAADETSQYASIYSSSGFDIMGVLAEVVSRPNPKINIGAVDLSCAFVLCDITKNDHPIIYVSEAFERLTGYTEQEIVGQNCRFLQGPEGVVQKGMKRTFVDDQTTSRLRSTIEDRTEIQASLINYRKGGQPFMNLISMIPIRWNSQEYRFYVGFQVDLVETPDAVTRRNPNGTYTINYQRNRLPNYVVPPPDIYRSHPDLVTWFRTDQVSTILKSLDNSTLTYRSYLDRILVENTDDLIHALSLEGEFLYLSPSCRKVLEYEPIELVGKTLSTVCHPSDIGPVIRDLRACTTTEPVSVVFRIRRKRSGYIWFESHGSWRMGERGRQFMVLVGRPRLVYCLDHITSIGQGSLAETDVWVKLSKSGIVLFMTSKARPVLGRMPDELIGKSLQDLMDSRVEVQKALRVARTGQRATFSHKIRHKKGHMLPAQTTLHPGDTKEGIRPSFLVAQISFPKSPQGGNDESNSAPPPNRNLRDLNIHRQSASGVSGIAGQNLLASSKQANPQIQELPFFTELVPTRGSSWQVELRELEKQNRTLSDELQKLLTRRKKRKRKQSAASVEKSCAMCQTKKTPEWRRGPSGERDLCNSCGLRWAKQVRNAAQVAGRPNAY